MVLVIYSGVNGYLDKIPVNRVTAFEAQMIPYVEANAPEIFENIKKENKISDATDAKIKETLKEFLKVFV
jgi:F0F1-type ATP synthase alpha subunit